MTKKTTDDAIIASGIASGALSLMGMSLFGPRVCFEPEGKGGQTADEGAKNGAADDKGTKDAKTDKGEDSSLLHEVMQKKEKIAELSTALEAAQTALKRFDGIDPDQVRELLRAQQEREQKDAETRGDFERARDMMKTEHAREIDAWKTQVAELTATFEGRVAELEATLAQAEDTINDLTIGSNFDTSGFITGETVLPPSKARALYGSYFDVEDGRPVAYNKPRGAADRTKMVTGAGETMSFEAAIRSLIENDPDSGSLLRSKIKPGAGSGTDSDAKAAPTSSLHGASRIQAALNKRKK
ncbi:hypothetical protein F1188_16330 [Roseospira marina]|uniref:DUF6651 domain-containing protein n=1 Tax=Roseospira marina TaxID=140057 RepID=A0A5M6I820_9PROT|nr:DUF6651 domain-containing protein [Roseospira marina]KAA5604424.1 hypothetical protein F1188_16330 [Roseospira marina]MBB4315378.1 hypothetical protein [Roseospira marina]MBB5088477.1 hypothetical protein [Roseospira marina]